jgi:hypothetical protein
MKNSLGAKGLSMSAATSISNLCNQRSKDIASSLSDLNNAEKTLKIGEDTFTETPGRPVPTNVVELLKEKSRLAATQAFLMENIKAKDELINSIKKERFINDVKIPEQPKLVSQKLQSIVDEAWGWEQLTSGEYNDFLEAEAYAAHIGLFIHKNGTLDRLRTQLPATRTLEFIDDVEAGKRSPLKITIHHTQQQLLDYHEELAALHRGYEQKVNYTKSKVKNSVTTENARIEKDNAKIQATVNEENKVLNLEFQSKYAVWAADEREASHLFESARQKRVQDAVALAIVVPSQFQPVVDMFLNQLK